VEGVSRRISCIHPDVQLQVRPLGGQRIRQEQTFLLVAPLSNAQPATLAEMRRNETAALSGNQDAGPPGKLGPSDVAWRR
jgi:hypothetical protein